MGEKNGKMYSEGCNNWEKKDISGYHDDCTAHNLPFYVPKQTPEITNELYLSNHVLAKGENFFFCARLICPMFDERKTS